MMTRSLYEILGVPITADLETIKKAYRTLSKTHHPDKGGNNAQFAVITEAWEILKDKNKRDHYDRTGDIPNKACNKNSQAAQVIIGIFDQWLASVQQKSQRSFDNSFSELINVDLMQVIKDSLEASLEKGKKMVSDLEAHIGKLEELETRCEGGFKNVVQSKIDASEQKIKEEFEPGIEAIEDAQEMIEDGSWAYVFDEPDKPDYSNMLSGHVSMMGSQPNVNIHWESL